MMFAHPHRFLDTRIAVDIHDNSITGTEITWLFDPFASISVSSSFDLNDDGSLDKQELENVEAYAFRNLEKYNYFTYLYSGSKIYSPDMITDFNACIEGDTLIYHFYTPFDIKISGNKLRIAFYDDSLYCNITYRKENSVLIHGNPDASWDYFHNRRIPIKNRENESPETQALTFHSR